MARVWGLSAVVRARRGGYIVQYSMVSPTWCYAADAGLMLQRLRGSAQWWERDTSSAIPGNLLHPITLTGHWLYVGDYTLQVGPFESQCSLCRQNGLLHILSAGPREAYFCSLYTNASPTQITVNVCLICHLQILVSSVPATKMSFKQLGRLQNPAWFCTAECIQNHSSVLTESRM